MFDRSKKKVADIQVVRDAKLAKRMCKGDQRAVTEFCQHYLPRLYRYARLRLPTDTDVDEVVQITLTQAARRIETFRGESTLLTWLIQICRHEISRHLHTLSKHDVARPFLNDEVLRAVVESLEAPDSEDPEVRAKRDEIKGLIQLALDQLPSRYAATLEMKYMQGMSYQEIAAEIGVSDSAVQSILARARKAFKEVCSEALSIEYQWRQL